MEQPPLQCHFRQNKQPQNLHFLLLHNQTQDPLCFSPFFRPENSLQTTTKLHCFRRNPNPQNRPQTDPHDLCPFPHFPTKPNDPQIHRRGDNTGGELPSSDDLVNNLIRSTELSDSIAGEQILRRP